MFLRLAGVAQVLDTIPLNDAVSDHYVHLRLIKDEVTGWLLVFFLALIFLALLSRGLPKDQLPIIAFVSRRLLVRCS